MKTKKFSRYTTPFSRYTAPHLIAIIAFALNISVIASAATHTVTNNNGGVAVQDSFGQILSTAGNGDAINFAQAVTQINVTTPLSSTAESLTISGLPQGPTPILDGTNITVGPGYFDGRDWVNDDRLLTLSAGVGTHTLSQLTFQNGVLKYTSPAINNSSAPPAADNSANTGIALRGGALQIASEANLDAMLFLNNGIIAQAGNAIAGDATSAIADAYAGAYGDTGAYGGGAYFWGTGAIFNSIFQGNYAIATGGEATAGNATALPVSAYAYAEAYASAFANGGGAYFRGTGAISNSLFQGNFANATGEAATAGNATAANANANAFANASAFANGGGAYFGETGTIDNSVFLGNFAIATGGEATAGNASAPDSASAYASVSAFANGGGTYFLETGVINDSIFQGNSANAIGGTLAQGGTATGIGTNRTWANADAYAFGGAVAFNDYFGNTNEITDSSFIANSVTATASGQVIQNGISYTPEALALGGAIFSSGNLKLTANAGNTVRIAGNTANGAASGIHFGRSIFNYGTGYFGDSEATTTFNVTANGTLEMLDPVTAELYRGMDNPGETATFAMNIGVGNTGRFFWGGQNMLDANGGSTVTFNTGTTTLVSDFQLTTTDRSNGYRTGSTTDAYLRSADTNNDLLVEIKDDATLLIDANRNANSAVFDFTNTSNAGTNGALTVENGATLGFTSGRNLLDLVIEDDFLLVDGASTADLNNAKSHFLTMDNVTDLTATTDQLWAHGKVVNSNSFLMRQNRNTWAARFALQYLADHVLTQAQFDLLTQNFNAATAEYGVSQMNAAFQMLRMVSNTAAYKYFDIGNPTSAPYLQLGQSRCCNRPRFWGGYLGEFGRMDRHGGNESYKTTTNGILIGADRRLGSRATIGVYGSYLDERTRYRSINAGVDADGFQLGMMYRKSLANNWKLLLDAGYGHFENDGYRVMAPFFARSSFKQDALSTGFGFEKKISYCKSDLTPFLRGRYIYAKQTGLSEHGNTGFESMVSSFDGNSFTTNLGAEWTRKGRSGCWNWETGFSAAWVHEYADTTFSTLGCYSALPGNVFQMVSSGNDRDRFELGTDLRIDFNRSRSAFLSYDYMVSSHTNAHAVSAGAAWLF